MKRIYSKDSGMLTIKNLDKMNDQKRINSPSQAIKNGSKMLIIGRSITQSGNPINSIKCILQDLEKHYEHKN